MTARPVFAKYAAQGAYHWAEVSRSLRSHNAFTHARYVRALRALRVQPGQRALDIGCGDAVLSAMLAQAGAHVVGIDYLPEVLTLAAQRTAALAVTFAAGSAYALPVASASFDAVVASDVIEHLDRPHHLIAEAHRALRPGGRIVITTPHRLTERPLDREHVSEFFPDELGRLLRASFANVTIQLSHPVWLSDLYLHEIGGRRLIRLLVNMMSAYFGRNPFLTDRRFRYYAQIIAMGIKP